MEREVEIARLGAQGDGVAEGSDGPLYVPFALPGERVRVAVAPGDDRAELLAVLQPSPDRVEPVCPHFGMRRLRPPAPGRGGLSRLEA
jgi:23S rRNA (uracil1939-C5)-methyltransferase